MDAKYLIFDFTKITFNFSYSILLIRNLLSNKSEECIKLKSENSTEDHLEFSVTNALH